jgi:hypothetical protein
VLAADDLSDMFGIDMAPATAPKPSAASMVTIAQSTVVTAAASSGQTELTRPAKSTRPAPTGRRQRLTSKKGQDIAERMRKYWAERRAQTRTRKAAAR